MPGPHRESCATSWVDASSQGIDHMPVAGRWSSPLRNGAAAALTSSVCFYLTSFRKWESIQFRSEETASFWFAFGGAMRQDRHARSWAQLCSGTCYVMLVQMEDTRDKLDFGQVGRRNWPNVAVEPKFEMAEVEDWVCGLAGVSVSVFALFFVCFVSVWVLVSSVLVVVACGCSFHVLGAGFTCGCWFHCVFHKCARPPPSAEPRGRRSDLDRPKISQHGPMLKYKIGRSNIGCGRVHPAKRKAIIRHG